MTCYTIDQTRLLQIHDSLDHINYSVGLKDNGSAKGKAAYGAEVSKITGLDCSGYVHYVLREASKNQINVPHGSWNINEWFEKSSCRKVDYKSQAEKRDHVLRLGYFAKTGDMDYGHIWLVLNAETLESHGSKGVNRRSWNNSAIMKHVTHCYEVANTQVLTPGKYRVTNLCKDPAVRKLLDEVIDNDKRISLDELISLVALVLSDNKVTMQEVNDLKTILEHSTSLDTVGRHFLRTMETNLRSIVQNQQAAEQAAAAGTSSSAAHGSSSATSKSPTQKANEQFFAKYPERKGKPIQSHEKAAAREWMTMYRQHGGR